jgi:hypothetical protein
MEGILRPDVIGDQNDRDSDFSQENVMVSLYSHRFYRGDLLQFRDNWRYPQKELKMKSSIVMVHPIITEPANQL